jgi:hypothetical protein
MDDPAEPDPYSLDSSGLGRIRRVEEWRDVWPKEAGHFTPWLYKNIGVLGEALGMKLTAVGQEVPVGEFRLDIKAEDADGNVVVIENQLERTDHGHLGQCLVYAARLKAQTVVWVAKKFRDDFRAVLDWLNERTDDDVRFFGVEVGLVRIGNGPPAPWFEVVSRPNDWAKSPGEPGGSPGSPRQEFFVDVLSALRVRLSSERFPLAEAVRRSDSNWINFASGPFGTWELAVSHGSVRVGAYIDMLDPRFTSDQIKVMNKQLFGEMEANAERWHQAVGFLLTWQRLPDRRACRIIATHPLDLGNETSAQAAKQWAASALESMFNAMNAELRERATSIKQLTPQKVPDTIGAGEGEEDEDQEDHLGGPDVELSP